MSNEPMQAREFLDLLRDEGNLITLAHYNADGVCDGRSQAAVIDRDHRIAVMLENCGQPERTTIAAGAIVSFIEHPESEPKIVGSPAYTGPRNFGGQIV